MSVSLKIEISDTAADYYEQLNRFRDFGEDLYREWKDTCDIRLNEIDSAIHYFFVRGIRRDNLEAVTGRIQQLLRRYHLDDSASLVRSE